MKNFAYLLVICSLQLVAQPDTEVFLAKFNAQGTSMKLSDLKNISLNEGYDNQPSFPDNNTLLYAATRNKQTDILIYDLNTGRKKWLSDSPGGSEYSPLKIPSKNAISAIRLDKDGRQLLYSYALYTGESEVLIADLKVGYHVWFSTDIIVATVLIDDRMDLVVVNIEDQSSYTHQKNVGRSLHRIPNSKLISYISKEEEEWYIKSLDPISGATKKLMALPPGIEDMVWLSDGTALVAKAKTISRFNPEKDAQWQLFHSFFEKEINNISRMAISPNEQFLAIVSDASPEVIINKQVTSFNAAELGTFISCFSDNVVVKNFPVDTLYTGSEKMKENYRRFMASNPGTQVEVTRRIIIGSNVIDAETVTVAGKIHRQVAIYEVDKSSISSMVFIHDNKTYEYAERIVQKQLDAYNARDIDNFMDTYSEDVQLYNYPKDKLTEGRENMSENYRSFFETTPDLKCEIKNRIVIGNKVIDEEFISANGSTFSVVAIYEIANDKIARVTFLR